MEWSWDRTPPQVPILGANDINNSPYTEDADKASQYKEFLRNHLQDDYLNYLARFRRWSKGLWRSFRHRGVTDDELVNIILNDYPQRSDVLVDVMDFSPGKSIRIQCKLEDMQTWLHKPDWSVVRWVHMPLGPSWLATFIEDEVLMRGPRGFPFKHAGSPEFPYFSAEGMSFWSQEAFHRQRNIFKWFSEGTNSTNQRIGRRLLQYLWRGQLTSAVNGYQGQRGRRPQSFWSLVIGELPRDLEEESGHARLADPHFDAQARRDTLERQIISRHRYYQNAQIVKSRIRFYHRNNGESHFDTFGYLTLTTSIGFVLSMAPPVGIQYLHRDWFEPSIAAPVLKYANNTWGALVPQAFHHLSSNISKWHRMDENWLMIYVATEMCSLPSTRLGGPGLKPEEAYFLILQDLKRRRRSDWKSKHAVDLVHDLVNFNDEVNLWLQSLERQKDFLLRLQKDVVLVEEYYRASPVPDTLIGEGDSSQECIKKALLVVEGRKTNIEQTFAESGRVLEALFRLRTIQQNELANAADRSNKAIVAFTVVTIIFLPLNFLTSYYSMLPVYTAGLFWITSAPIGVAVLFVSLLFAFRLKVAEWFRKLLTPRRARNGAFHRFSTMA